MVSKVTEKDFDSHAIQSNLESVARNYIQHKVIGTFWQRNWDTFVFIGIMLFLITPAAVFYNSISEAFLGVLYLGTFGFMYTTLAIVLMFYLITSAIKYFRQRAYLTINKKIIHLITLLISYIFGIYLSYNLLDFMFEVIFDALDKNYWLYTEQEQHLDDVLSVSYFIALCSSVIIMIIIYLVRAILIGYGILPEGLKKASFFEKLSFKTTKGCLERYVKDMVEDSVKKSLASLDKLLTKCYLAVTKADELTLAVNQLSGQNGELTEAENNEVSEDANILLEEIKRHQEQLIKVRVKIRESHAALLEQVEAAHWIARERGTIAWIKRIFGVEKLSNDDKNRVLEAHQKILDNLSAVEHRLNDLVDESEKVLANEDMPKADLCALNTLDDVFEKTLSIPIASKQH
ncbi:MAG: hypothetical protein P1P90_00845 [Patescibacteria group bacterium]|nr:hypothetical protein [Patescibacteria group bacterium]